MKNFNKINPALVAKKKCFTFLAACLLSMSAAWAQYTFTVFNANTGTLTYYYDTYANMQKMGGEEYDSSKDRFKNYAQDVWTVVIDESMKDAPFRRLNRMFYGGPGNELSNVTEIIGLENLNTPRVIDMTEMFYGCKSLQSIDVSKLNTENVENMNGMFELCASLKTLDLSKFSTSNVKDMSFMFDGCKALESVDLSSFNTQNVNDMNSMFYDCENLTVLNIAHFDMQSVTIVSSMFGGCKKLKTIYCNDDWNTIDMDADETFEECYSLVGGNGTRFDPDHTYLDYARPDKAGEPGYFTTYEPEPEEPEIYAVFDDAAKTMTLYYDKKRLDRKGVLEWMNTSTAAEEARNIAVETVILDASMKDARPESTESWFENFQSLTEIRHLDYLNTEKVENMYSMFEWCLSLENLDVSHFKTGKVQDMGYMFAYVPVKKLDLSNFDTKNVASMAGMFVGCSELTELNLLSFDMNKVEYTSYMFADCSKLKTIKCDADLTHIDDANSQDMFKNCTSLVGGNGTECDGVHDIDATYARPDEEGKPGYFTAAKTGLDEISQVRPARAKKLIKNGLLLIERNGHIYDAQGQRVK